MYYNKYIEIYQTIYYYVLFTVHYCLQNLLSCTSMGWLEEIFGDNPTIAINCETSHL
jgi:hypothetical protein